MGSVLPDNEEPEQKEPIMENASKASPEADGNTVGVPCGKQPSEWEIAWSKSRLGWLTQQLTDDEAAIVCQYVLNVLKSRPR